MTVIVSISEFRQHIAEYIAKAKNGHTIVVKDEKKGQEIAKLVGNNTFNPESFGKALKAASGTFTTENHPEWRTKEDVIQWVEEGRKAADRTF